MRKLAVLAAVLTAATAWGADYKQPVAKSPRSAQASPARSQAATGSGAAQTNDSANANAGDNANANATPNAQDREKAERDRLSKDDFSLKGTVARVSGRSVTVNRDNSTPATLEVDSATKIEVDGKAAQLSAVKPGDDIKASFNLRHTRPIAVDLKASSKK